VRPLKGTFAPCGGKCKVLTFFVEIKNVPICFADVRTAVKFPRGRDQLQRTEVMDLQVQCPASLVIL